MKRIILIAFLIINNSSFAQISTGDYNLKLSFAPSFMYGCKLVIQNVKDKNTANITFNIPVTKMSSKPYIQDEVLLPDSIISPLTEFLKTYKFPIKNNVDTIAIHKEFVNGDSIPTYAISAGLDGINVGGELTQNGIIHHLAFWSPEQGTPNQKLMSLLFNMLYHSFKNDTTINYLEQLEQYFPHQLGVIKISDQPLKYKLYGNVTANDSLQFDKFLSSLPLDSKTYIDMSNFSLMGTMFFPVIRKYCNNRRNIYWLNPSYTGLVDLYKIGIDKKYIISKKELVKIKDKDGNETIITKQIDK